MKETRKQIIEQTRNEVARKFHTQIMSLNEDNAKLSNMLSEERNKNKQLLTEIETLKDKLSKFEDWNQRLQEFMDMSEEERSEYLEKQKVETQLNKRLNSLMGIYSNFLY